MVISLEMITDIIRIFGGKFNFCNKPSSEQHPPRLRNVLSCNRITLFLLHSASTVAVCALLCRHFHYLFKMATVAVKEILLILFANKLFVEKLQRRLCEYISDYRKRAHVISVKSVQTSARTQEIVSCLAHSSKRT